MFLVCQLVKVGPLKHFRVWTIPNTCQLRWQSPPNNVSAEKLPEKVARLCRTLLNSNTCRGIQCTQKLHVHVDFYTQQIVFENTLNISQNERLSQSQHSRNIASNYVYTTQIAPPLRDDITNIRRAKTSFTIKHTI